MAKKKLVDETKTEYNHPGVDADLICRAMNYFFDKEKTRQTVFVEKKGPNFVTLANEANGRKEVEITFSRRKDGKWNWSGLVIYDDGSPLRYSYIKWEKGIPVMYNQQCLLLDEEKRSEILKENLVEFVPFLYHSVASGPVWLWLNKIDPENIRKIFNPIYFDLKWMENIDPTLERYYDELAFKDLRSYYEHYGIKDSRIRNLMQTNPSKPQHFILQTQVVSKLLELGLDSNHIVTHWKMINDLLDQNQNTFIKVMEDINKLYPIIKVIQNLASTDSLTRLWGMISDINRLYGTLKGLNPIIEIPKQNKLEDYHDALSNAIVVEESRKEQAPFTYWPGEVEAIQSICREGYSLRMPENKADLRHWGNLQGHCIGTYAPSYERRLISIWKDEKIVSCLEIRYKWDKVLDAKDKTYKLKALSDAAIIQHKGFKNYEPKIESPLKSEIEKAILDVYNRVPTSVSPVVFATV